MTEFIESLKRLYKTEMIADADAVLKRLLESKKISNEELNYIIGKEG